MKRSGKLLIVIGIILVVCNIAVFAVPFPKTVVFWISDAFVLFSLAAFLIVDKVAFRNAGTAKSKFYGFPILRVGVLYVVAILICATVFIILSCVIKTFPVWLPIVVYVILTGAAAIGMISMDSTRNYVEQQDAKMEANTSFIRHLYAEIVAIKSRTQDAELVRALTELAESVRYSDPVSGIATEPIENRISTEMASLYVAVGAAEKDAALLLCRQIAEDLIERNAFCKANKGK